MSNVNVGFYGKIPARGDFVRINAGGAEARDLSTFLEASLESLVRGGCEMPEEAIGFLYRKAGAPNAVAGLIKKGTDKVGRKFPSAYFTTVAMGQATASFPSIPFAFKAFVAAASTLADDAKDLDAMQLEQRLVALPVPSPADYTSAQSRSQAILAQLKTKEFVAPLFGKVPDSEFYAFRTLATACAQSRGSAADPKPGITLDFPVRSEDHQVAWLEMVRRFLAQQPVPPTVMWTVAKPPRNYGSIKLNIPTEGGKGGARLLVAFGASPSMGLAYLANMTSTSQKLWPLFTDNAKAVESAKTALTPPQRAALENAEGSLEAVVTAFGA